MSISFLPGVLYFGVGEYSAEAFGFHQTDIFHPLGDGCKKSV